ncbi:MAG TPA: hypothetical protein VJY39_23100 [Acidisphaera sp.]|nr:hypothetical protein [Acidisphaera sp.]
MQVAQAFFTALDLAAQMAGVGAHEVALDLAAVAVVPRFDRAAMGDHRPELGLELRRHRLRAAAGDLLAVACPELPAAFAVFPALGEQAHGASAGELVERDLGLPVAMIAGGDVVGAGGLAVVAAGLAAAGPAGRPVVAPRGEVAAPGVGAEQLLRRRAVLAEGVVGDFQPVVPRLAGAWPLVVRRQRAGPGLAGVGDGVDEAAVEPLERGREKAKHGVVPPFPRLLGG